MGRIYPCIQRANVRPIWGNFEGRWIFQISLIKTDFINTRRRFASHSLWSWSLESLYTPRILYSHLGIYNDSWLYQNNQSGKESQESLYIPRLLYSHHGIYNDSWLFDTKVRNRCIFPYYYIVTLEYTTIHDILIQKVRNRCIIPGYIYIYISVRLM